MDTSIASDEFDIRQYVEILKRRKWIILASVVACVLVAAVVSFMTPKVYTASSKVVISAQQDIAGTGAALGDPNQTQNQIQTQVQVLKSPAVKLLADQALGARVAQVKSISAAGVTNTRVLTISAVSESKTVAQAAANAYSDAYLKVGEQSDVNRLLSIGNTVQQKQQQLQSQIDQLNSQIAGKAANANDLRAQVAALQSQHDQLQSQYNATQALVLVHENTAQPLAAAEIPTAPSAPKPLRNIALALVLGLLIGVGGALLIDRMDDRLRSASQLGQWLPEVTILGSIPKVPNWNNEQEAKAITLLDQRSPVAEAYRSLRTNLEFLTLGRKLQVIQVSSAVAGDGKSTTAANLAVALAWSGKRVVVVAADLRRPRLHEFYGLSNEVGLTSIMLSNIPVADALQKLPVEGEAFLLASGPLPPNPAELLSSARIADVFDQLRRVAEYVIVDSAPLLPVSDAMVLSSHADAMLLVARVNTARKGQVEKAVVMAEGSRAGLAGIVVNGVTDDAMYSYDNPYYTEGVVDVTDKAESKPAGVGSDAQ